jgi:glycosyltransferase involved in cell wall biosynthesis
MKIGVLGTRGIPNAYGGFEQFAQFLAKGLFEKGHEVWVYSSSTHPYQDTEWMGIQIIHCKDPENKIGTGGQFIYDLNCFRDAAGRHFDILLQLGYTSSSVWHRYWPKDAVSLINMDGLEWKRSKYNWITRRFLRYAEWLAVRHGDHLIADSLGIQEYLLRKFQKPSSYIPYGALVFGNPDDGCLKDWNLEAGHYLLIISRMEPENNIELMIRGYLDSGYPYPLVIVGNTSNRFGNRIRKRYIQDNLRFIGSLYNLELLNNLRFHCASYLHGHSVGGTNPSLLEAMACSCPIIAHLNPFNQSILGDCAGYFESEAGLAGLLAGLQNQGPDPRWVEQNLNKIKTMYRWDNIISQYETLFLRLVSGRTG